MKIVRSDKIIDLDKFESVRCRESYLGKDYGFPVMAIRHESALIGTKVVEEEIARVNIERGAKMLVADISSAWVAGKEVFNVDEWFAAHEED